MPPLLAKLCLSLLSLLLLYPCSSSPTPEFSKIPSTYSWEANWDSVASSADGVTLVAGVFWGQVWTYVSRRSAH